MNEPASLAVWRHPKPGQVHGRCIGRTDVGVDRRKAKRLAHRIRHWARRHGVPRTVLTSSLQRAVCVGRCLADWGWHHRIDSRLNELDFGHWDGLAWDRIGADAVQAWCHDFAGHRPGGGESVSALLARSRAFLAGHCVDARSDATLCVVGHAGWIGAAQWLQRADGLEPTAAAWPVAVRYASLVCFGRSPVLRARPGS